MPLDLDLFRNKLTRYRAQFKLSLDDLAAATGMSLANLSALEGGTREPTGDEVLILADYYKTDFKFFISNERVAPFEQTEMLFRKHDGEFTAADRWAIQEFLFLCECEEFLLRSSSDYTRKPFKFIKTGDYFKGHAEKAARALRQQLEYGNNPTSPDVYNDLRRIGLHVFRRKLENSHISGLFIKHPFAGKCVLVNYSEDLYRQRFTAGHEGGHAILDDEEDFVVSFTTSPVNDLSEIRANTFSSRYLLPPEFLVTLPTPEEWTDTDFIQWAQKLGVNAEALSIALKEANLLSEDKASQFKYCRIPVALKDDPELPNSLSPKSLQRRAEYLERGLSTFYVGQCFSAYESRIISAARLAEMLLTTEHELHDIAQLFGRRLDYGN
jgi:Zn-dependent peptidase ImmA (M78 family)/transcriptional regulator with XRE-family HTH domain